MMKRVAVDSYQSYFVAEEARVRFKQQSLLQEYLEVQKEFVSKKKQLQKAKQKREILLAEVRFLRRRHKHLKKQSQKFEPRQDLDEPLNSYARSKLLDENWNFGVCEAVLKKPSPVVDLNPISDGEDGNGRKKEEFILDPLEVDPKNCLISEKRVGKKKISWQDPVVLKVSINNREK